jgi:hypothetical protein
MKGYEGVDLNTEVDALGSSEVCVIFYQTGGVTSFKKLTVIVTAVRSSHLILFKIYSL